MKKYLNTLFVTTQGAWLNKEGEAVVVSVEKEVKLRVPIHTLGGIVCFGAVSCSQFLMNHCAENNVIISYLTENGRFLARVHGPVNGNVLLRREQYRRADDPKASTDIARSFVLAKIANSRTVLQRHIRNHADKSGVEEMEKAVSELETLINQARKVDNLDSLRGVEGMAGNCYFSVFSHLITAQKDDFTFTGRNRRPPVDNVNALLSFIYTLLVHDCTGALEAVGLDPQVGFLHRDRSGRPSLALDMMEEFRAFFADRLVLSLINLKQIQGNDFEKEESGAVKMKDDARKNLLVAYQKRKQEESVHPFIEEAGALGVFFHLQAQLLARYLRGDMDAYPPFIWK